MKITKGIIDKYGPTSSCPLCENLGKIHNAECRARIEKLLLDAGETVDLGGEASKKDTDKTVEVNVSQAQASSATSSVSTSIA